MHLQKMDLGASIKILKSGIVARIYLIKWLREVSSLLLDSSSKLGVRKRRTLAALFIKRSEIVDQVLEKIEYDDYDFMDLTTYRHKLAESHDKFFMVIAKINDPGNQEALLSMGCQQYVLC